MKPLTQEEADSIHKALDEIMDCSDALYQAINNDPLVRLARGFSPTHTLNSAVGLIRSRLQLAGYANPRKEPRK